jgi:hypothetical protein
VLGACVSALGSSVFGWETSIGGTFSFPKTVLATFVINVPLGSR